jgi:hypothetical protein
MTERFAAHRFGSPNPDLVEDEHNTIEPIENSSGEPRYFVVRKTTESLPSEQWEKISREPPLADCVPYRWNPLKFTFEQDSPAAPRFCRSVPPTRQKKVNAAPLARSKVVAC